jgi:hypothetical protein
MSSDRDLPRIVQTWLHEDANEYGDRVLDSVLDQLDSTPQRRASWLARRFPPVNNNLVRYGLAAVAVAIVAIAGFSLLWSGGVGQPGPSATPTASESALNPLIGMWAAPETTCEQQMAAIEAAGFTAAQITAGDPELDPTCTDRGPNQFTLGFAPSQLLMYDETNPSALQWQGAYRIIDSTTFEAGDRGVPGCVTYHYVIEGDQLTVDLVAPSCPGTAEASLGEQVTFTGITETSPFTLRP